MVNTKSETTGLKLTSCAWLAGYVDGEGCISLVLDKKKDGTIVYYPRLNISNTHLPTLNMIEDYAGGGGVSPQGWPKPKARQSYQWQMGDSQLIPDLLRSLLPYLQEKAEQAQMLLDALLLESHEREDYYWQLKNAKNKEYPREDTRPD